MGLPKKITVGIPAIAIALYLLNITALCIRGDPEMEKISFKLQALINNLATIQYTLGGVCNVDTKLTGKVVIITGANTGIGKMNALDHVQRGARVIMACRSLDRGQKAANEILAATGASKDLVQVMKLDLSSLKSIRAFVDDFKKKETRLDILINNAGLGGIPYSKTEDGFETTMGVNHLGHFLLTNLLLDILKKSAPSRIVIVSARAHEFGTIDLEDLHGTKNYGPYAAYMNSKLANVLFNFELARRLQGTGVTTYALHPGAILTDFLRYQKWYNLPGVRTVLEFLTYPFMKDAMRGAQTQICCAVDPALSDRSGKYYSDCAETEASHVDEETARKLWEISAKMVGLEEK